MSLSPTDAWREAVTRDGARIRVLVEIYDGTNTWKAVSGSMDSGSNLANTDVAIQKVTPLGVELDPFTRSIQISSLDVDIDDAWIRPRIVNYRLKGQRVNIKLGAASLDESDFLWFATNAMIENIEPTDEHTVKLLLLGQFKIVMDAMVPDGFWLNAHPLEALYDGAGGGILEKAGGHSFDADSFDRTQARYDSIDHVIVGRAYVFDFNSYIGQDFRYDHSGMLRKHEATGMSLSQNVIRLINGYLLEDEEGRFKIARFDSSASAIADWGVNDIVPGSFRQEVLDSNIINQIAVNYSADPEQKLRQKYVANDATSQDTYKFPGETKRVIAEEFDNIWVGAAQHLYGNINDVVDELILSGPTCYAVSGNRADMTIDGDHPVYLLLDSSQLPGIDNIEIVKCEGLTRSSTFIGSATVRDFDGSYTQEGPYSAHLTFTTVSRAQRGTDASAHTGSRTTVYDITALVLLCDELLERFADGCPIIEFETGIDKFEVQIGDLVTVTWPAYLAYGDDGITNADKWEAITKETDVFADPPVIRWRFAHAGTSVISAAGAGFGRPTISGESEKLTANKIATQFVVFSGLGVTQDVGLNGIIAAGLASNGVRSVYLFKDATRTFTALRDTYVYLDITSSWFASPSFKETALGLGDPGTEDYELFLSKVITDGAGITSSSNDPETKPINGTKLVDLSVGSDQITALAVTSAKLGADAVIAGKIQDGAVDVSATLANAIVVAAKIGSSAVTTVKVASNAIGTSKIVADATDLMFGGDFNDWNDG